jgi:hypothetical protein
MDKYEKERLDNSSMDKYEKERLDNSSVDKYEELSNKYNFILKNIEELQYLHSGLSSSYLKQQNNTVYENMIKNEQPIVLPFEETEVKNDVNLKNIIVSKVKPKKAVGRKKK